MFRWTRIFTLVAVAAAVAIVTGGAGATSTSTPALHAAAAGKVSAAASRSGSLLKTANLTTRAGVVRYVRAIGLDPRGLVIQRGARNYAGAGCPGAGWACSSTTHPVVQIAGVGGRNRFSCTTARCAVVQVSFNPSKPPPVPNTATCIKTTGLTQSCSITQPTGGTAIVYQNAGKVTGLTQTASYSATINQTATGSTKNKACVSQLVNIDGSTTAKKGTPVTATLRAHQNITISQDSFAGNSAASAATPSGQCDDSAPLVGITQNQTLTSTAYGTASITQLENDQGDPTTGPNLNLTINQNQGAAYLHLPQTHGTNTITFSQQSNEVADASGGLTGSNQQTNGPVVQTQSKPDGGILAIVNQFSKDKSTISATQVENQCELAQKSGSLPDLTTDAANACFTALRGSLPGQLTQTQFGPVGSGGPGRSTARRSFAKVGKDVSVQGDNPDDTFGVSQTSKQKSDSGSTQTNFVQGDCSTSGNCTDTQNTTVNGTTTMNVQTGQNVSTTTNCTGSACTSPPPPTPTITSHPSDPSTSSSATFAFTDSSSTVDLLCQIDGLGYSSCSSPATYNDLANGSHTFSVKARNQDAGMAESSAATFTWTVAVPTPTIVFDGSPGTGAPPSTLGPYTMTAFGVDPRPTGNTVTDVTGPTGTVGFSPSLTHSTVGNGWATWSNGYTGDVYWTGTASTITITLPAGTGAFYLYAEPNQLSPFDVQATAQDGTTSDAVSVDGNGGAEYFGFYGTGGATIVTVTVTTADTTGLGVGEFGISAAP
ncbi:MAG: hypothetical protein QOH23_2260 [Gaiellaceae bacterium]|jgi:hypothetical protein|nr:hypothetical protein [Gaiellaceae bacterium]